MPKKFIKGELYLYGIDNITNEEAQQILADCIKENIDYNLWSCKEQEFNFGVDYAIVRETVEECKKGLKELKHILRNHLPVSLEIKESITFEGERLC